MIIIMYLIVIIIQLFIKTQKIQNVFVVCDFFYKYNKYLIFRVSLL